MRYMRSCVVPCAANTDFLAVVKGKGGTECKAYGKNLERLLLWVSDLSISIGCLSSEKNR